MERAESIATSEATTESENERRLEQQEAICALQLSEQVAQQEAMRALRLELSEAPRRRTDPEIALCEVSVEHSQDARRQELDLNERNSRMMGEEASHAVENDGRQEVNPPTFRLSVPVQEPAAAATKAPVKMDAHNFEHRSSQANIASQIDSQCSDNDARNTPASEEEVEMEEWRRLHGDAKFAWQESSSQANIASPWSHSYKEDTQTAVTVTPTRKETETETETAARESSQVQQEKAKVEQSTLRTHPEPDTHPVAPPLPAVNHVHEQQGHEQGVQEEVMQLMGEVSDLLYDGSTLLKQLDPQTADDICESGRQSPIGRLVTDITT